MERAEKEQVVGQLKDRMAKAASVILADFKGIPVETITQIRREFRSVQCEYKVVKNTLLTRALQGTSAESLGKLLEGPTGVIFAYEDPSAPAKLATKFAKEQEAKFVIKGGFLEGKTIDAAGVEQLGKLPGKNELRAKLLATFMAPATNVVRLFGAAPLNFMYLMQARFNKGE